MLLSIGILMVVWGARLDRRSRAAVATMDCASLSELEDAGPRVFLTGCMLDLLHAGRTLEGGDLAAVWVPVPVEAPRLLVRVDEPWLMELVAEGTQAESTGPIALQEWIDDRGPLLRPTLDLAGETHWGWDRSAEARAQLRGLPVPAPALPVLHLGQTPSRERATGWLLIGLSTVLLGFLGLRASQQSAATSARPPAPPSPPPPAGHPGAIVRGRAPDGRGAVRAPDAPDAPDAPGAPGAPDAPR